jgi:YD repeat-containing protein
MATYTYDSQNRLTNLVHSNALSSFAYTLLPNGLRQTANETLKHSDGITTLTQTIQYGYDNLNRLVSETATDVNGDGYDIDYTLDIVGNRFERTVTANGQILTTEYRYYEGSDKLEKEIHTGPLSLVPVGQERYYAYADPEPGAVQGKLSYRSADGRKIGKAAAFMMGLPTNWSQWLLNAVLVLLPIAFFIPVLSSLRKMRLLRRPDLIGTSRNDVEASGLSSLKACALLI